MFAQMLGEQAEMGDGATVRCIGSGNRPADLVQATPCLGPVFAAPDRGVAHPGQPATDRYDADRRCILAHQSCPAGFERLTQRPTVAEQAQRTVRSGARPLHQLFCHPLDETGPCCISYRSVIGDIGKYLASQRDDPCPHQFPRAPPFHGQPPRIITICQHRMPPSRWIWPWDTQNGGLRKPTAMSFVIGTSKKPAPIVVDGRNTAWPAGYHRMVCPIAGPVRIVGHQLLFGRHWRDGD